MLEQFVPGALPKMAARKKFECNVAALRVLAALEAEKREATREERAALALYTGWGDTEVRRYAFDWAGYPTDEFAALGLNEAVLEQMRRSVLNAHYTDMGVVDAMWQVALHLGFASLKGPRVLEPSAGVGHFIGRAPYDSTDLRPEAVVGVELDTATHAVCKALYPRCDVRRGGFEEQELPSSFDLIIGNVPFGDYGVSDDRLPEGCRHQIHDYFICRSVDLLRPGGVAILITSKGTLDKKNVFVRRWLAERADLLGAFRLPSDAFADNAGTEVTTDVLVLQRLTRDQPGREVDWLELGEVSYVDRWGGKTTAEVNLHFITHPDHVFGMWTQNKLGRGVGVTRREGEGRSAGQMLVDALGTLPSAVLQKTKQKAPSRSVDVKGELTLASPQEMACGRVLRAVRAILAKDSAGARRLLRVAYDAYKSAYGSLRQAESHRRHPLNPFTDERWWPLVASLEDDAGRECGFLVSQPTTDAARPKPECALDAMYQILDESGSFDLDRVAERLGTDREAARVELRGAAFQLGPDGAWETAERYLCGDVVGKLDEARRWASVDAAFAENVTALERVQPERVTLGGDDGFTVPFGAPWVPTTVYAAFLAHLFPAFRQRLGYGNGDILWGATLRYVEATATWVFEVTDKHVLGSVENTRTYGTKRMSAIEIMEYGLKLQIPTVYDDLADGKRTRNEVESAAAQAKLAEIRDRWTAWLPANEERKKALEDAYNARFNRMRVRTYDGSRLTFPGLSPTYQSKPLSPYPHQRAGAQRVLERGEKDDTAMIAYMPGAGKTLTAVLGVVKRLQLGLSTKAVIVVPKNVLGQWQDAFYALYPGLADWLLPGSDRAFDAANRRRFLLQAATGGAKVILLTYEQFRSVSIQPETFRAYLRREVLDLEQALIGTAEDDPSQRGLQRAFKQREKALADFSAKYEDKWKKVQKAGESDLSWEKWGVDLLTIDECFRYETLVLTDRGLIEIGKIVEEKLDVKVMTHNGRWMPIVRWLTRSSASKTWVKVSHEVGSFVCTAEHKIWTDKGFVVASELKPWHTLKYAEREELSVVQPTVLGETGSAGQVLRKIVLGQVADVTTGNQTNNFKSEEGEAGSDSGAKDALSFHSNEVEQPNEGLGASGEAEPHVQGEEVHSKGREWSVDRSSEDVGRSAQMEDGNPYQHEGNPRCSFGRSRVVGVEVLKRGDLAIGDGGKSPDHCYDLEVEEDHTYYADGILVSNCHSFKNDVVMTKMQGVSGLPRGESQRAFDMRVKLHYVTTPELFVGLDPRDGGKAVALTGTPVTNSLAETWIMLRHLQPRLLREYGLWHFDAWAATFTTQVACPEMDATGGWRLRTRLKFHNLSELQDILGLCWDRVDPRFAGGKRPSIVGDRMRVVETQGSDELREYTQQLADRADLVRKRAVDPEEDNMLKITHDGRVASLFNGFPSTTWPARVTKLDACVDEVWNLYCQSDDASGVQLVFVDLFTPKANSDATLTSAEVFEQQGVYGVLKQKLVRKGMLSGEVEFVHDAASDDERGALFERANAGKVRVLIGSTARMGLGVNVQKRAYAVHHLTVPWRPDWLDQANKRVDRDGNTMEAVHIVCYPTTGSYDVVLWQLIETKATFVAAINSGTYAGRSADDIGDLVIDATTAKAIALGDLRVVEKVKLELELNSLQRQYRMWKNDNSRSNFEAQSLPRQIAEKDGTIADLTRLKAHRDANQLRTFAVKLRPPMGHGDDAWITLTDRARADHLVRSLSESLRGKLNEDGTLVGQYRGLDLLLRRDNAGIHLECTLPGGADVEAKNVHLAGTSAFVVLETQLAALETQICRLNTQRSILSQRLATLQATALAWSHKDRALSTLARYDDLCSQIATAGIVDRQTFRFD